VQVNCRCVADDELIKAMPAHPVVVGEIEAGRFVPEIVKVVSFPTAGELAVTALIVPEGADEDEPPPQAKRAKVIDASEAT
jgi:hypothetical protein